MIQVIDLLDHLNIPYKTSGNNVTSGWVEINCLNPNCGDPSFHFGINLSSGWGNCWRCGHKSFITSIITDNINLSYPEASKIVKEFSDDMIVPKEEEIIHPQLMSLPKEATKELPPLHVNYLLKRNFDPSILQRDYGILATHTTGYFAYRIVIPIIVNHALVNFTARDVTGQQDNKYKNCDNRYAIMPTKETIYNIDTVKDKIIICEGPTDVWRIGKGSVATMGVEYTTTQLALLAQKEAKEIFILYDSDAITKAEKLASAVSTFCPKVEIIELEDGDPGSMDPEDVIKLRKEIGVDE